MQVLVWSAYKGYIATDLEVEMAKLSEVLDDLPVEDDPWLEDDDPGLQMFLEQTDLYQEQNIDQESDNVGHQHHLIGRGERGG